MNDEVSPPGSRRLSSSELRDVQLGILRQIDDFCRAASIRYYLAWGTLLGAVRHRGYIPWDDDIDLMMMRPDYDRFCATFPHGEPPSFFSLGSPGFAVGWPYPFAKVSDDRTALREESDLPIALGVNVDIFPVDEYANGFPAKALQLLRVRFYRNVLALKSLTARRGRNPYKTILLMVAKPLARSVPAERLVGNLTRCAGAHKSNSPHDIGVMVGPFDWRVPQAALGVPQELEFEGRSYPAPSNSDQVLKAIYGDYMRLPPPSERISHHRFSAFALDT